MQKIDNLKSIKFQVPVSEKSSPDSRAAYRYRFFDIDTNTDTTFRYRYQFDPYRDIHVTISRVRLFYTEKWRIAIKSTTHNLLQLPVQ